MTSDETDATRVRAVRFAQETVRLTGYSIYGTGIGFLAFFTLPALVVVAFLWCIRIGQPLVRPTLAWVRHVADLERARLGRLGHDVPAPATVGRREVQWLVIHATWGLVLGALGIQLLIMGVHDTTYPLWWTLAPEEYQTVADGWVGARSAEAAAWAPVWGVTALVVWLLSASALSSLQSRPGLTLLRDTDGELTQRVSRLTATRAAALDAHAVELRRIERALHDGAQNRIVGVAVLIGAARREVERDPARADQILARAQDTTEDALAELRAVVRSILPPVLENRGLAGSLSALAADCPVPCSVVVDVPVRCPVSVEATAYFTVAESLTNVAKHSRASQVHIEVTQSGDRLRVRITDDGVGGADPTRGTGLTGIIGRVDALDGTVTVTSPVGGPTDIRVELPCGS